MSSGTGGGRRRDETRESRVGSPRIPFDLEAEEIVAAFAIGDAPSASAASEVLDGTDFYDRRLGRLFAIAVQLENVTGERRRTEAVAGLVGTHVDLLLDFTVNRPSARDASAIFARRVREAARRRRAMGLAAHIYNGAAEMDPGKIQALAVEIEAEATRIRHEMDSRSPR